MSDFMPPAEEFTHTLKQIDASLKKFQVYLYNDDREDNANFVRVIRQNLSNLLTINQSLCQEYDQLMQEYITLREQCDCDD